MHKNPLWLGFLAIVGCCIVGYTCIAGYKVFRYATFSSEVEPYKITFKTTRTENFNFVVEAEYHYFFEGQSIKSRSTLPEHYLNRWAAQQQLPKLQKLPWKGWVNPRKPSESTLQKNFPIKECISTAILWGILLYFMGLGLYVGKNYGRNHS